MKEGVRFEYNNARVPQSEIKLVSTQLEKERLRLKSVRSYQEPSSAINLCLDTRMSQKVKALVKKLGSVDWMVVIGIGGSNLGTLGVQQALQGTLSNEITKGTKVLYADTIDSDEIAQIISILKKALKQHKKVVLNIISKSGNTIETIANAQVLLTLLRGHINNYHENIIVTSNENSPLDLLAQKNKFHRLHIPKQIGGRYSVLSPVGLFPLALMGIDSDELSEGAKIMRTQGLEKELNKNPPALSAALRYYHALHGQTIQDLFLFGNDFDALGKWYRQLFAESLGKGCDSEGKSCIGVTPTYSIGSTDMHSIAQLYLGGPFDKLTTFVKVTNNKNSVKMPMISELNTLVKNLQGKSVQTISDAIYQGVVRAFAEKKRPFIEITIPNKSARSIGQLLQFHIMEVMYLGALLKINPFDQPDIESYKQESRKILAKK